MKEMKRYRVFALFLCMLLIFSLAVSCTKKEDNAPPSTVESSVKSDIKEPEEDDKPVSSEVPEEKPEPQKNGEVYVLFTSDVHCGIDSGFGYDGLFQIKKTLESSGYTVILVDDGDALQGEPIGMLTEGESIIELMNEVGYDVAIPGNHEFDYGIIRFMELADKAEFRYISCNFNREGELMFDPYTVVDAAGTKIGFVGVTTPTTLTTSTPAIFQDENGKYIYSFMNDQTGEAVYKAVQEAVDKARADGAEYVYLIGHMGMSAGDVPWTYADVIQNTTGIDVFLDGHTHDTEQAVVKNREGKDVIRSGCGTKLQAIGYSHIVPGEGIKETDIWTWNNPVSFMKLAGIANDVTEKIDAEKKELEAILGEKIAETTIDLTIFDPSEKDEKGSPIRMVRRAETNAGDICADAFRYVTGADIGITNGGGVRADIKKGDITYGDILKVMPFNNQVALVEATGQQILDALEFGSKDIPSECGGFLQVSGLSYEVDVSIPSGCRFDENGMMTEIVGERRVRNVMVGDEPLDPKKTYTVGGSNYVLVLNGDGCTAFNGAKVISERVRPDSQAFICYIQEALGGKVGREYEDPYGQGRIKIITK
ncbi:MAG: bifunctional metallophosphatase/5'-nucleotidase [Clostridia bacterium]|nr:bifunctional metallophosphatase/5'-nucleotidase [Clostridia bacterium]